MALAEGESDSQAPTPFIFCMGAYNLTWAVAGVVDSDVDPRMCERATKSHFIKK